MFYGVLEIFHETPVKPPYEMSPVKAYLANFSPPELGGAGGGDGARRAGGALRQPGRPAVLAARAGRAVVLRGAHGRGRASGGEK